MKPFVDLYNAFNYEMRTAQTSYPPKEFKRIMRYTRKMIEEHRKHVRHLS